jgi:hypothetical protein
MIYAIIAIVILVLTIGFILWRKPRSKVFFVLCLALALRLARIVIFRFFMPYFYQVDEFNFVITLLDVLSIVLYILIIGLSVLLLVKGVESKEK